MESAAALRSFHCSAGIFSHIWSSHERPGKSTWSSYQSHIQGLAVGKLASSTRRAQILVSCSKTTGMILSSKSDGSPKSPMEKHTLQCTTFPDIFEALVLEVCDETSVAEVKLKVGDFEMHLKRNIGGTNAPIPVSSPTIAPPVPTDPMFQSANSAPSSSTPKSSPEKVNSFVNPLSAKSSKLASLEASGSSGYKLVSSPTVGSFRKGRTVKGKKQPPICKEGDVVKEGQIIGYVDQFGTELPVKSDVDGEVLKILFDEGEPVGYGDPLVAVLPSFHGIQ
ncbi:hypothetical protein Nepgr_021183 [Nepenthes gracilis]|uniref:Lipoyl-binding domain-containing protein n=1 Tax=Nepenthes gracilis TaxID=150966 RepID=A0AAD3SYE2_NEPGR|nr:hypothetical protein Nepgr_021183 [Nepenthes gracilis]